VPTAVLSNHTGYPSYFIDDYTKHFEEYVAEWKKLGLRFNGISTGFLGSVEQAHLVAGFIHDFRDSGTVVAVDPVMGDNGSLYSSYTDEMCREMRRIVREADLITPNLTEACLLTDTPYHTGSWHIRDLRKIIEGLREMGPQKIVITGIEQGGFLANLCSAEDGDIRFIRQHRIGEQRSGTGDLFSAIVIADAVNGVEFGASVRKATRFIKKCIMKSIELGIPTTDGVAFEECLDSLHA
jgi:pyridoxine kinase